MFFFILNARAVYVLQKQERIEEKIKLQAENPTADREKMAFMGGLL